MKLLYLLGYPVSHSMSAMMQNAAFRSLGLEIEYNLWSVNPDSLVECIKKLREPQVLGCNVTIPHKITILHYLDELDPSAKLLGAVNTVLNREGVLKGFNTDGPAAIRALREKYGDLSDTKIVILGSGGAAKAVAYYLSSLVQQITIVSRDKYKGDLLIETLPKEKSIITLLGYNEYGESLRNADILINATPIGMYPNTNESLIPKSNLHQNLLVFDLVYNPRPTKLLKDAKEVGCRTLDGLTMLVYQGCGSFKIWTGRQAPEQIMKEAAEKGLEAMTR